MLVCAECPAGGAVWMGPATRLRQRPPGDQAGYAVYTANCASTVVITVCVWGSTSRPPTVSGSSSCPFVLVDQST